MMLASDPRGKQLGYAAFAQELGSRTTRGFVPNCANAAQKARDRTEPIVGAKVLLAMFRRFNETWVIEYSFDALFLWHDWASGLNAEDEEDAALPPLGGLPLNAQPPPQPFAGAAPGTPDTPSAAAAGRPPPPPRPDDAAQQRPQQQRGTFGRR
eukprot:gene46570-43611_t